MKISAWKALSRSLSIGKTALAAGLSWEVAQLTGTHRPYFAPLAAILCLQVTVEESLWQGYQRVLGIVGGVVLSDIVARYIGIHGWSIALLVLLGTGLAGVLKLGKKASSQVGVSAMMVLTVGGGHYSYSIDRIVDTVIGAVIAILINMFVFPPDYTPAARESVTQSATQLAGRFQAIAEWLLRGANVDEGRALQDDTRTYLEALHQTEERVRQARQALKFSPMVRRRREGLRGCEEELLHLRQGYAHATGSMRTLLEWSDYGTMTAEEVKQWVACFGHVANVIQAWKPQNHVHKFEATQGTPSPGIAQTRDEAGDDRFNMASDPNRFRYALYNDTHQLLEDFGEVSMKKEPLVIE
jgi:Aromatic acid exporter family member 1